ncbi:MAG: hypothetical protein ACRC1D_05975 [Culicoidibacterales bacterium]
MFYRSRPKTTPPPVNPNADLGPLNGVGLPVYPNWNSSRGPQPNVRPPPNGGGDLGPLNGVGFPVYPNWNPSSRPNSCPRPQSRPQRPRPRPQPHNPSRPPNPSRSPSRNAQYETWNQFVRNRINEEEEEPYGPKPSYGPDPNPNPMYGPDPNPNPMYGPDPNPNPMYGPNPNPNPMYGPNFDDQMDCSNNQNMYGPNPNPNSMYEPDPNFDDQMDYSDNQIVLYQPDPPGNNLNYDSDPLLGNIFPGNFQPPGNYDIPLPPDNCDNEMVVYQGNNQGLEPHEEEFHNFDNQEETIDEYFDDQEETIDNNIEEDIFFDTIDDIEEDNFFDSNLELSGRGDDSNLEFSGRGDTPECSGYDDNSGRLPKRRITNDTFWTDYGGA